MKLSEKQQDAFDEVLDFMQNSSEPLYVFSGVAGSGKSTIINELVDVLGNSGIAVLAFTGKAAKVLRDKGISSAKTIHSYLYRPIIDEQGNLMGFAKKDADEFTEDYIIVDEGSMIDEKLILDLHETGRKILVVGDVNQLPPISNDDFNIMDNPQVRLDEIHRLAEDNPIIRMSQHILHEGTIPVIRDSDHIQYINKSRIDEHLMECGEVYDTILCGTNRQRTQLNKTMRRKYGYRSRQPMSGEKLICLQNNLRDGCEHYNGDIFTVEQTLDYPHRKLDIHRYQMKRDDGYGRSILVDDDVWFDGFSKHNFVEEKDFEGEVVKTPLQRFDFGYAMTVWKAQGSEYKNLLFLDEDVSYFVDRRKFRYTAITRSKDKITIAR